MRRIPDAIAWAVLGVLLGTAVAGTLLDSFFYSKEETSLAAGGQRLRRGDTAPPARDIGVYRPFCAYPKDHDEADLCIQELSVRTARDALYWNRLQTIFAAIGTLFLIANLVFMRRSTEAIVDANTINRDAIIADQRAWLVVSVSAIGSLIRDRFGHGVAVQATVTNIGKTPAHAAHSEIVLLVDPADISEEVRRLCAKNKAGSEDSGRLVLPGETYQRPWYASSPDRPKYSRAPDVWPSLVIIGCTTYKISQDKSIHQTSYAYYIGPKPPLDRSGIDNIPITEIYFQTSTGSDAY